MNYREYLKSIGMDDAKIAEFEKAFGPDLAARAFEGPLKAKVEAEKALAAAKVEKEEFEAFYQNDVLPKVSTVYQDAINWRTRASAAEERLKAAKEYGFLSEEGAIPGAPSGTPVVAANANPVPGSPGNPNPPALDSRYVEASKFVTAVNDIPQMLGRLTKMSNEHFSLYGSPLLDVDELIAEAQKSGGKRNVQDIWEERYKVSAKRKEIADKKSADHDREVGESAIRKYVTDNGGTPHTAPGILSRNTRFASASPDDVRQPWKGAKDRKTERRGAMLDAIAGKVASKAVQ